MTLKIDFKVKTNIAERWPPLSWTTFIWTIFLYSAYQRRYSGASIKMGRGVCIQGVSKRLGHLNISGHISFTEKYFRQKSYGLKISVYWSYPFDLRLRRSGQGYIDFLKWNTQFLIQESNSW